MSPIGSPVAGSPTSARYSRWPWAWPVSPSATERNSAARRGSPRRRPSGRTRGSGGWPGSRRRTPPEVLVGLGALAGRALVVSLGGVVGLGSVGPAARGARAVEHDRVRRRVGTRASRRSRAVGAVDVHVADRAAASHTAVVVVVDVGIEMRGPPSSVTCGVSPISARSVSVEYTVRSEMPGISARALAYSDSAVGCGRCRRAGRNSSCRCGVILSPLARKASASSVGASRRERILHDCSLTNHADCDRSSAPAVP